MFQSFFPTLENNSNAAPTPLGICQEQQLFSRALMLCAYLFARLTQCRLNSESDPLLPGERTIPLK